LTPQVSTQYTWVMTSLPTDYTGPLTSFDDKTRADLGKLMAQLSTNHDGSPIDANELQLTIDSPDHEEFVAIRDGTVIGAGSLSIIPTSYDKDLILSDTPATWLGSFIVDESYRGRLENEPKSIAAQLFDELTNWTRIKGLSSLQFMTELERGAAVNFYKKMGAHDMGIGTLFNLPLDNATELSDISSTKDVVTAYETCKTYVKLHLYGPDEVVNTSAIRTHTGLARDRGISFMQYIAPKNSATAERLVAAGLEPKRDENILRVQL